MKSYSISRRNFLGKTVSAAGLTTMGSMGLSKNLYAYSKQSSDLPREVWIATVSQMGLKAHDPEEMVNLILKILENAVIYKPDIVCLPEVFATSLIEEKKKLTEKVKISGMVLEKFSDFAKKNNCYLVCPVYTTENGKVYNSAVVLNRYGEQMGEYRKIHPTENEIGNGITPGPLNPPVFETDFGIIGIQICFDILWDDGWEALKRQGAEIVFWPSAYAGGQVINAKAWRNKYIVASSTRKNTSKICDITGEVIAQTGIWDSNLICAPVNLEKAFLHTWPYVNRFNEIREKYGRKIKITNYHEEEWSVIESLSPDIRVKDILDEFDLKTYGQLKTDATVAQGKARSKGH
jgi:predicted amidohydrolase